MSSTGHRPYHLRTGAWASAGFSLVEVLVAAMLLAIGAAIALGLFTAANQLFRRGQTTDRDQIAISSDLAEIQRRNRRLVCTSGSCDLFTNTAADPKENQYTPVHPGLFSGPSFDTFTNQQTIFQARCTQPAGAASGLISDFKTKALDTLPAMTNGISRSVDITSPATETPPTRHAYVVTYTKNGQVLRRLRLVPTVAGWCP
ncbi:MAG: type II secretion system protein [Cyanobacteriota bacterium]|nr:type II secretion system protein [Cyanobacteriota bacterium]